MYAVGTHEMVEAMGFDFLGWLPHAFVTIALLAWMASFVGFARSLLRRIG